VLEEGTRWNWFERPRSATAPGSPGSRGTLFVIRSLTFAQSGGRSARAGQPQFRARLLLSFVTGIGIFSTIYLTPLFLGYVRGFSAWQTGVAIFSTGAASLIGVPVYIMLARKFDLRWLMMFGLACSAVDVELQLHHP
jgi:DHA2 family multidrug resistance protein